MLYQVSFLSSHQNAHSLHVTDIIPGKLLLPDAYEAGNTITAL